MIFKNGQSNKKGALGVFCKAERQVITLHNTAVTCWVYTQSSHIVCAKFFVVYPSRVVRLPHILLFITELINLFNQIQLREHASCSYCARSWRQQTSLERKKFPSVWKCYKTICSYVSCAFIEIWSIFRDLQTSRVLHISTNARWRMNIPFWSCVLGCQAFEQEWPRVTLLWYQRCFFSNVYYFVIMRTRYWSLLRQGHLQPQS